MAKTPGTGRHEAHPHSPNQLLLLHLIEIWLKLNKTFVVNGEPAALDLGYTNHQQLEIHYARTSSRSLPAMLCILPARSPENVRYTLLVFGDHWNPSRDGQMELPPRLSLD